MLCICQRPFRGYGEDLGAYREWLGINSPTRADAGPRKRPHKVDAGEIDLTKLVELIVLSASRNAARCRIPGRDRVITLRADIWTVVPSEIVTVTPRKLWSYAGHPYLSGTIESSRLDVTALELVPLKLEDRGLWSPDEHYWGEEDEPIEEWARPIIASGTRREFEMEQVLPGADPDNRENDPITRSNDLGRAGDRDAAAKLLMMACEADPRCLDAHSHLGNMVFDHFPDKALRHYEAGARIGELSLAGETWPGHREALLPWGWIDNRPYLRCLHGLGLCLWRLGRFKEATEVFDRMLWLNPMDNQGVRFLIDDVREGIAWEKRKNL